MQQYHKNTDTIKQAVTALGVQPLPLTDSAVGQRFAIAVAQFNANIGARLVTACIDELIHRRVTATDIVLVEVPGALEIAQALALLAKSHSIDALIGFGAVIRGETYHFEIVADVSARSLARLSERLVLPVINGILTVDNEAQALARVEDKGRDSAKAAIAMAALARHCRSR